MRYISNTPAQQKEMLALIGASSIEDLLVRIPTKARLSRPLSLPRAMAETDHPRFDNALASTSSPTESMSSRAPPADRLRHRQHRGVLAPFGGPSDRLAEPLRVGNFSDRVWGDFGDP